MNMAEHLRPYYPELRQRDRGCTGKVAYATSKDAARKGKVWTEKPYHCQFCGQWHLTKNGMGKTGGERR